MAAKSKRKQYPGTNTACCRQQVPHSGGSTALAYGCGVRLSAAQLDFLHSISQCYNVCIRHEARQLQGPVVTELCVLLRIFGASVMLVVIIERLLRSRWRPA